MKFVPKIFALVVIVLMFSACGKEIPTVEDRTLSQDIVVEDQTASQDIVNENLPVVSLNDVSDVEVQVGQKMFYLYELWPSVGIDADYSIDNPDVVASLGYSENIPDTEYPGGDDGSGTFYFVAKSRGSATIKFMRLFRGDVEGTTSVRVDVK